MSTHSLTLQPTDVLFFKDGRPMDGASSGHGAAWPMPNVLDSALHHALRRAGLDEVHSHTVKRNGIELNPDSTMHGRQFGSLQTAGPFPVDPSGSWLFPRPADADQKGSSLTTHCPLQSVPEGSASNLPADLAPVINTLPPSKEKAEKWMSHSAYQAYLSGSQEMSQSSTGPDHFDDDAIFAAEHNIGIGIDPSSGAQDGVSFYSASYLRLKRDWSIGMLANCMDKGSGGSPDHDLIEKTFQNSGHQNHILAGGQQRTCGVKRTTSEPLPLPLGVSKGFRENNGKHLIRWTLLTPAIFPYIKEDQKKNIYPHPGGWLPLWIDPETMQVKLKHRPKRGLNQSRADWRIDVRSAPAINAKLVAAVIPRPIPVTGWALTDTNTVTGAFDAPGGARATHLAVPAGAVYYFEADNEDEDEAKKLAVALNWHGTSAGNEIQNRRSSLLGEKGFGLGVCSKWNPHKP